MSHNLSGQVAFVTGAGRGIGRSIATQLAKAGASVGLMARRREDLDAVASEIESFGGKVLIVPGSVTNQDDVVAAIGAVIAAFGPITFLVNNAGQSKPYGKIGTADPLAWWSTQEVHVLGPMLTMSAVIPSMIANGGGRIMNVASMAAKFIGVESSAYTVSKATVVRLGEHVHAEHKDAGIKIFSIHPGSIVTDMVKTSMADPTAPRRFDHLDPNAAEAELLRVGAQAVELASGEFDDLAGEFIDLEKPLSQSLSEAKAAKA